MLRVTSSLGMAPVGGFSTARNVRSTRRALVSRTMRGPSIVCASGATADGGFWGQDSGNILDSWQGGTADCGASACGTVPIGAFVLVKEDCHPVNSAEAVQELEKGYLLSTETELLVGNEPSKHVNLLLNFPGVSGRHARIECVPEEEDTKKWWTSAFWKKPAAKYYVTDLGSDRGTFLNRVPLVAFMPFELAPGDILAFGSPKNSFRVVKATAKTRIF